MKQFYETYKDDEFVSALLTQISWTDHLLIMSGSKFIEEQYFYMAPCVKEHSSSRELERQMNSAFLCRSQCCLATQKNGSDLNRSTAF